MGNFDPGLLVWSLLTFAAAFAVLGRFAFKPIAKLLADREQSIRKSLDDAREASEEAQRISTEAEEELKQVRGEAGRIIAEGHRIVADMKREASESACKDAEEVVKQARTEIEREVQRSLDELKTTVANLSIRISRQVIRENLDEDKHQALAEDFIERLKKSHANRPSR